MATSQKIFGKSIFNWAAGTFDESKTCSTKTTLASITRRILNKNVTSLRMNTMGIYPMDYQNTYSYASSGNPFAVQSVQDALSGSTNSFKWDANGNMVHSVCNAPYYERHLCWTEDNRLQGYSQYSEEQGDISAWYNYAAGGDRNFKITSPRLNLRQNAEGLRYSAYLKYPTLYASALITFNKGGYTKHYFEGSNRICSRIGGGFSAVSWSSIENRVPELDGDYESLFNKQNESVNHTFDKCLGIGIEADDIIDLYDVVKNEHERDEQEPAFFYHSDHLGSAAYLTNDAGQVTQTLNYLPYGEDWVDVQNYVETHYPRLGIYTFNGKEKDYESGFHYYGARYYWSELLTGYLSVDRYADKYPSLSPYHYCAWNPIILTDPTGDTIVINNNGERIIYQSGMQYSGSDVFISNTIQYLNDMAKTPEGSEVLNTLCGSSNNYTYTSEVPLDKDGKPQPAAFVDKTQRFEMRNASNHDYAHEIFHAYQYELGMRGKTATREVGARLFEVMMWDQICSWPNFNLGQLTGIGAEYPNSMMDLFLNGYNPSSYFTACKNFLTQTMAGPDYVKLGYTDGNILPDPPIRKILNINQAHLNKN